MNTYHNVSRTVAVSGIVFVVALLLTPYNNKPAMNQGKAPQAPSSQQGSGGQQQQSGVVALTNSFNEMVLESSLPVVVDAYTEWCPMCQMMLPVYHEVSQSFDFQNKVKFVSINVDKFEEFSQRYNIQAIPTFLFFSNGKLLDRVVGAMDKEKLSELIRQKFSL